MHPVQFRLQVGSENFQKNSPVGKRAEERGVAERDEGGETEEPG